LPNRPSLWRNKPDYKAPFLKDLIDKIEAGLTIAELEEVFPQLGPETIGTALRKESSI